jgi:hypothetical protein
MAAAAHGELDTQEGISRAARRMLNDPKAREALDEFTSEWLRFDRVLTATRERRAYPQFTPETALAMTQEARRFVADLVWNGVNFTELFRGAYGYPNADLARIYGSKRPRPTSIKVPFPQASERGGLFGQALFLTPKPDDTSPRLAGFLSANSFSASMWSDPPPGVRHQLPPLSEARLMTNRERMADARHK